MYGTNRKPSENSNSGNEYKFFNDKVYQKREHVLWWESGIIIGHCTASDAENMLKGHPSGTFLIRFGSQPANLVISAVKNNDVRHTLLQVLKSCTFDC